MTYDRLWKKRAGIVFLLLAVSVVLLFQQAFQDVPAVKATGFLFIFIAFITLFPLSIARERPGLSRYVSSNNNRAPPSTN